MRAVCCSVKDAFSLREGDVRAACSGVKMTLRRRCCCVVKTVWVRRCSSAWRQRGSGVRVAWGLRGGGGVGAGCYCVGVAWELRGGGVGAVLGWHGSDARAAPEVRVEGCTS